LTTEFLAANRNQHTGGGRTETRGATERPRTSPGLAGLLYGLDWKPKTLRRSKTPCEKINRRQKKNEEKWIQSKKVNKTKLKRKRKFSL
jgi:hypothetical protein